MADGYEVIANKFVTHYYALFDSKATREQASTLYHQTESCLSFEGSPFQGAAAIREKHIIMPFDDLKRMITTIDIQPVSGGMLIQIIGQLRTDSENDHPFGFSQTFLLRELNGNYFLVNDIFRLAIHNF